MPAPPAASSPVRAAASIQRFDGAFHLNAHIHALALDGMFARDPAGAVGFQPTRRLTSLDVAEVLAAVEPGCVGCSREAQLNLTNGRRRRRPEG